jgi:PelA/Pel-15E family pectate lyase
MKKISTILMVFLLTVSCKSTAQDKKTEEQNHPKITDWNKFIVSKDDNWFSTGEAKNVAENVLLYQRDFGGWPKNIQMQNPLSEDEKQKLLKLKSDPDGCTTDNGATCQEMLFLSKVYKKQPDERYKNSFLKGLMYLISAQYGNGGFPQFYPLKKGYYTHITYNDDAMVNILKVFKELKNNTGFYSITPPAEILAMAGTAFDKGIDCILKTQYKQNGVLTSWCAQHDEVTLLPAKARAYELPSLSGKESGKITLLLMSIENPSKEIVAAVEGAVKWFEKTKITGIKIDNVPTGEGDKTDRVVVQSPGAEPLWARFMELENNKPFFCDRDGVKKATLAEIGYERRNGYAWYTNEPKEVFKKYQSWKEKLK